jgi:hypothetical protein
MSRLLLSLVAGLWLLGAGNVSAQFQAKQTTYALIRCESIDNQESTCKVDTYPGVRLLRELSRGRCFEGRSYGIERDGIWVSDGCAAEFEIGRDSNPDHHGYQHPGPGDRDYDPPRHDRPGTGGPGYGQPGYGPPGYPQAQILQSVICKSIDRQLHICPLNIGRDRVELRRKISKAACVQGQSWGYDRRSLWVDRGCRGEFAVVRVREPVLLVCESINRNRQYCPANTVYGVEIRRQISRAACVIGQSWGYDRNAIWVDDGCRAEFLLR